VSAQRQKQANEESVVTGEGLFAALLQKPFVPSAPPTELSRLLEKPKPPWSVMQYFDGMRISDLRMDFGFWRIPPGPYRRGVCWVCGDPRCPFSD